MTAARKIENPDVAQLSLLSTADVADQIGAITNLTPPMTSLNQAVVLPEQIHIERLIEHGTDHLNKRLELADVLVDISNHKQFFAEHISAGFARGEWGACFPDPDCDVAHWCAALLGSPEEFVEGSKALATRLYGVMRTRVIAHGDLVVAIFRKGSDPQRHIALLKLDTDSRRLRNFRKVSEQTQVDISVADNILPESKTLAKCAIITPDQDGITGGAPGNSLSIRLLDNQAGPRTQEVAAFFFRGFLATELVATDRQRTRAFVRASGNWASQHSDDLTPAETEEFYGARRTALQQDDVNIEEFAKEALPGRSDLHAALIRDITEAVDTRLPVRIEMRNHFAVDRVIAKPVIDEIVYEMDGGARLTIPASMRDELLYIVPDRTPQNKTRLVLETLTLKEVTRP
jgi:hypothetical protein